MGAIVAVRGRKPRRNRNPLEPLASATWLILGMGVLALVAGVFATALGHGSFLGWGHDASVCVKTSGLSSSIPESDHPLFQPNTGVSMSSTGYQFCTSSPSMGQHFWYAAESLPETLTVLGAALSLYLLLRHAERNGIYSPGVAVRLRFLGWFLLGVTVLRPAVETLARVRLLASMVNGPMAAAPQIPWLIGLAGLAALSAARIMRVGSAMREDLEGVV
jgi:hypothetical protein